jgi:hypothetical protein
MAFIRDTGTTVNLFASTVFALLKNSCCGEQKICIGEKERFKVATILHSVSFGGSMRRNPKYSSPLNGEEPNYSLAFS